MFASKLLDLHSREKKITLVYRMILQLTGGNHLLVRVWKKLYCDQILDYICFWSTQHMVLEELTYRELLIGKNVIEAAPTLHQGLEK